MRKHRSWPLIPLIIILFAIIIFEPSWGWKIRTWLSPIPPPLADTPSVVAENEALKAQLAKLQSVAAQLPQSSPNYLRAMVYSRYPFNFKNELLVDAGSDEGVAVGKAVVFQGISIGTVEKVFKDYSVVQTIFDSSFKMPVRVGTSGYDALLVGGAYPRATSIEKHAPIKIGDIIYSVGVGSPYGLPIGIVDSTSTSPDNLFEEAAISFAYDINGIQTVFIAH